MLYSASIYKSKKLLNSCKTLDFIRPVEYNKHNTS